VWRERGGGAESASLFSYSTCAPNAACGDATCDPLERLEPPICPQDCANFSGIRIYMYIYRLHEVGTMKIGVFFTKKMPMVSIAFRTTGCTCIIVQGARCMRVVNQWSI
jgi:hypothetical protein